LDNVYVEYLWNAGVYISHSDYITVTDSFVHWAGAYQGSPTTRPLDKWSHALGGKLSTHITLTGNDVWECHTEGIGLSACDYITCSGNRVWDTTHTSILLNHGIEIVCEKNFVWQGTRSPWNTLGATPSPQKGLSITTEMFGYGGGNPQPLHPISVHPCNNITVRNNLFVGCSYTIYFPDQMSGTIQLSGIKIYHNTWAFAGNFITSLQALIGSTVNIASGGCLIKNNIFYADTAVFTTSGNMAKMTWGYNCWFKNRPTGCNGTGDVLGDPLLKTPDITRLEGTIFPEHFKILAGGSCDTHGTDLDVADDYWGSARGNTPDIGAHEL
jgi:hypothetical protein